MAQTPPVPGRHAWRSPSPAELTREELKRQVRAAAEGTFQEISRILADARKTIAAQEETIRSLAGQVERLQGQLARQPKPAATPQVSPHEIQQAIDRALREEFGL